MAEPERGSLAFRAAASGSATLAQAAAKEVKAARQARGSGRSPSVSKAPKPPTKQEQAKQQAAQQQAGTESITKIGGQTFIVGKKRSGETFVRHPSTPTELRLAGQATIAAVQRTRAIGGGREFGEGTFAIDRKISLGVIEVGRTPEGGRLVAGVTPFGVRTTQQAFVEEVTRPGRITTVSEIEESQRPKTRVELFSPAARRQFQIEGRKGQLQFITGREKVFYAPGREVRAELGRFGGGEADLGFVEPKPTPIMKVEDPSKLFVRVKKEFIKKEKALATIIKQRGLFETKELERIRAEVPDITLPALPILGGKPIFISKEKLTTPLSFEIGFRKELREKPLKTAITTGAFFVLPVGLAGVGKLLQVTRAAKLATAFPKVTTLLRTGVTVGLPTAFTASLIGRVATQPTPTLKAEKAGRLFGGEIIPIVVGGGAAIKVFPRVSTFFRTRGKQDIEQILKLKFPKPTETFPMAPTKAQPKLFKEEGIPILPGERGFIVQQATTLKFKPRTEISGGKRLGEFEAGFVTPGRTVSSAFLRLGTFKGESSQLAQELFPALPRPTEIRFGTKGFIDISKLTRAKIQERLDLPETRGFVVFAGRKTEIESLLSPKTPIQLVRKQFFFVEPRARVRVPVEEFEVVGLEGVLGLKKLPKKKKGKITTVGEELAKSRVRGERIRPIGVGISSKLSKVSSRVISSLVKPSRISKVSSRPSKVSSRISKVSSRVSSEISKASSRASSVLSKTSSTISRTTSEMSRVGSSIIRGSTGRSRITPSGRRKPTPKVFVLPKIDLIGITKPISKKRKLKRPTRFQPSLVAILPEEKIFAKIPKGPLTGLEVRGIPI